MSFSNKWVTIPRRFGSRFMGLGHLGPRYRVPDTWARGQIGPNGSRIIWVELFFFFAFYVLGLDLTIIFAVNEEVH